jgi:hypothetical protein
MHVSHSTTPPPVMRPLEGKMRAPPIRPGMNPAIAGQPDAPRPGADGDERRGERTGA